MKPAAEKVLIAINGPAGPRIEVPKNYQELSQAQLLQTIGYFEGELPVHVMAAMTPEHAICFTPNGFYEIVSPGSAPDLDFIVVPKNGSTYVQARFGVQGHGQQFRARYRRTSGDITLKYRHNTSPFGDQKEVIPVDICNWNKNKKILIVRNPMDRVISSYQHMLYQPFNSDSHGQYAPYITIQTKFWNTIFGQLGDGTILSEIQTDNIEDASSQRVIQSFVHFLEESEAYGFYNEHMFTQASFMTNLGLSLSDIDYPIPFEDLREAVGFIVTEHSLEKISHDKVIITHRNGSKKGIKKILKKFLAENTEAASRVARLYADDVDLYHEVKSANHFYS